MDDDRILRTVADFDELTQLIRRRQPVRGKRNVFLCDILLASRARLAQVPIEVGAAAAQVDHGTDAVFANAFDELIVAELGTAIDAAGQEGSPVVCEIDSI